MYYGVFFPQHFNKLFDVSASFHTRVKHPMRITSFLQFLKYPNKLIPYLHADEWRSETAVVVFTCDTSAKFDDFLIIITHELQDLLPFC